MLYGLYLSAAGVIANSYRQDVIANNLANAETVGFKKDITTFKERMTAAMEQRQKTGWSDPLSEGLGGGIFAMPTLVDHSAGEFEATGNNMDAAIEGDGYFAVNENGQQRLTRNGQFMLDKDGNVILSSANDAKVLDPSGQPIKLEQGTAGSTSISKDGYLYQNEKIVGQIGVFSVEDPTQLQKQGGTLMSYPDQAGVKPMAGTLRSEFVEHANVDPATELSALMDTQRQLEANANMIRYQDQTLQRLVNDVGKVG